jgi:hypothetical protein
MFITPAEHEQGWKQVEITLRSGKTASVTLSAPTRAEFRQLQKRLATDKELDELYELTLIALKEQAAMVDQLDMVSAQLVESMVIELTYGSAFMDRFKTPPAEEPQKAENADPNAVPPGMTA